MPFPVHKTPPQPSDSRECVFCNRCLPHLPPIHFASFFVSALQFLVIYLFGAFHLLRQALLTRQPPLLHCNRGGRGRRSPASPLQRHQQQSSPIIILSGATSGIGCAIYASLSSGQYDYCKLILLQHDQSNHKRSENKDEYIIPTDFSDERSIDKVFNEIENIITKFPLHPVQFIHCVGIYNSFLTTNQVLNVNAFIPCKLFFKLHKKNYLSSLIILGSITQFIFSPTNSKNTCPLHNISSHFIYPYSKAFMLIIADFLAHLSKHMNVMVIHPGIVNTNLYQNEYKYNFILKFFITFFAWSSNYSAKRILYLINNNDKNDNKSLYWDTVTLKSYTLPHRLQYTNTKHIMYKLLNSLNIEI